MRSTRCLSSTSGCSTLYRLSSTLQAPTRGPVLTKAQSRRPTSVANTDRRQLLVNVTAGLASAAVLLSSPGTTVAAEQQVPVTGPQMEQALISYAGVSDLGIDLRKDIVQQRQTLEAEVRQSQGDQLCATPFGFDIAGISIFVALIGAAVGGYTAKLRKQEAEKLNDQLRIINASLRQQARAAAAQISTGSSSSSGKTAAVLLPPGLINPSAAAAPAAAAAAPAAAAAGGSVVTMTLLSMDEDEMTAEQLECKETLRTGKRLLKQQQAAGAQKQFEAALVLSRMIGDRTQERRATRGLAAAARLQGQYKSAIQHLQRVLEISQEMTEYTGDADAYGSIADCYTELGNFERAAEFYDKYIVRMEN